MHITRDIIQALHKWPRK